MVDVGENEDVVMGTTPVSERNAAIVAAVTRGVSLHTVCRVYDVDALTVRRVVESAGETMPVDIQGGSTPIGTREAEMLRRALAGEDFSAIAPSFDVSREWVRLVVKRHTGLSAKDLKKIRGAARQQFRVRQLLDLAATPPDMPLDELAQQAAMSVGDAEVALGPAEAARRRRTRTVTTAIEREEALAEVRRVASLREGSGLSGQFYDQHRSGGVTKIRLIQMFGTWAAACEQAGVKAARAGRGSYTQKWDREDCLRWVLTYLRTTDSPSFSRYDSWSRTEDGAPSGGTIRLRCGKWVDIVRDAYELESAEREVS